jgi:prepilin-type N-terminal cleavage/methylation domain-containing protein
MYRNSRKGFTLVELLVVMSIMAILAAIILANMSSAAKRGRDAERQADLRNLQTAIEAYKHRNGKYPAMGCTDSNGWSTEKACATYISGLAPNFIPALPHDSARGINNGYSYVTNTEKTVYKIMAMNTVEADTALSDPKRAYSHPFKSCDIRYGDGTNYAPSYSWDQVDLYGWCNIFGTQFSTTPASTDCISSNDTNDAGFKGSGRFDRSYGLWGGFAEGTSRGTTVTVKPTTDIICK